MKPFKGLTDTCINKIHEKFDGRQYITSENDSILQRLVIKRIANTAFLIIKRSFMLVTTLVVGCFERISHITLNLCTVCLCPVGLAKALNMCIKPYIIVAKEGQSVEVIGIDSTYRNNEGDQSIENKLGEHGFNKHEIGIIKSKLDPCFISMAEEDLMDELAEAIGIIYEETALVVKTITDIVNTLIFNKDIPNVFSSNIKRIHESTDSPRLTRIEKIAQYVALTIIATVFLLQFNGFRSVFSSQYIDQLHNISTRPIKTAITYVNKYQETQFTDIPTISKITYGVLMATIMSR